jgi:hypothetical protein
VGTALLSTIFASATAAYTTSHIRAPGLNGAAAIHGYTVAFTWAAGIFALGLMLALLILPSKATRSPSVSTIAPDDRTASSPNTKATATAAVIAQHD